MRMESASLINRLVAPNEPGLSTSGRRTAPAGGLRGPFAPVPSNCLTAPARGGKMSSGQETRVDTTTLLRFSALLRQGGSDPVTYLPAAMVVESYGVTAGSTDCIRFATDRCLPLGGDAAPPSPHRPGCPDLE